MRKQLSKSEIKNINENLKEVYNLNFLDKKDALVYEEKDGIRYLKKDNEILFFYYNASLVPSLKLLLKMDILKEVIVDSGAVRFISSGADVMRPGITFINPEIKKDEFVVVKEHSYKKPVAVGIAMFNANEMQSMKTGKVIKTLHYVGDKIWNA